MAQARERKKGGVWNLTRPVGNVWKQQFRNIWPGIYYKYAETYFAKSITFGFESRFALRHVVMAQLELFAEPGFGGKSVSRLIGWIPCRESL